MAGHATIRLADLKRVYEAVGAAGVGTWTQSGSVLVQSYHRRARVRLPNAVLHAAMHAVVETQIAMRDPDVFRTLERLLDDGPDRHEALQAIGSVLAAQMWSALHEPAPGATSGRTTAEPRTI